MSTGTFYFRGGCVFYWKSSGAKTLVTRSESEGVCATVPESRQHVRENGTFCGQNLAKYEDVWTLPWLLPLQRFVLRFLAFLDNQYAGVAVNCSNADHVLYAMCWNTWWH